MANPKPEPDAPPVESIDEGDLRYHQKVVATMQHAQKIMERAQVIDSAWWEHLAEQYGLAPDDTVHADGTITRASVVTDTPPVPD